MNSPLESAFFYVDSKGSLDDEAKIPPFKILLGQSNPFLNDLPNAMEKACGKGRN